MYGFIWESIITLNNLNKKDIQTLSTCIESSPSMPRYWSLYL